MDKNAGDDKRCHGFGRGRVTRETVKRTALEGTLDVEHHFCESASLHLRVYHAAVDAISKVVQREKEGAGKTQKVLPLLSPERDDDDCRFL